MFLHKSSGVIRYGQTNLVLDVDQQIVEYYRSMLNKRVYTNRQLYNAHISVVRKEVPPNMQFWGKYAGEVVDFEYSHEIRHGTVYYWLDAYSVRLEEIRAELGLVVDRIYTQPPTGYNKTFHISLGNIKESS